MFCAVTCRYNYYITHGIDTEHIAPLDRSWIERVLALLAPRLRRNKDDLITCLVDEMRDDYLLSVKKAIIDFVLRDPRSDVEIMVSGKFTVFSAGSGRLVYPLILCGQKSLSDWICIGQKLTDELQRNLM